MINQKINTILRYLRSHKMASSIYIVGSVAKGSPTPRDVDVLVDMRGSNYSHEALVQLWSLLYIASRQSGNYGLVDIFVMFSDRLVVRNDEATGWAKAKNAKAIKANFVMDMVPVCAVQDVLTK